MLVTPAFEVESEFKTLVLKTKDMSLFKTPVFKTKDMTVKNKRTRELICCCLWSLGSRIKNAGRRQVENTCEVSRTCSITYQGGKPSYHCTSFSSLATNQQPAIQ